MQLLLYSKKLGILSQDKSVDGFSRDLSEIQGRVYDLPESVKSISSFIKTCAIQNVLYQCVIFSCLLSLTYTLPMAPQFARPLLLSMPFLFALRSLHSPFGTL
jgi:hypothetical protein